MGSSISPYNANMISYIKQTQITQREKLTLFLKSGTKNYRNQHCSNNEGKFNLATSMISIIDLLYTDWRGVANASNMSYIFTCFFGFTREETIFSHVSSELVKKSSNAQLCPNSHLLGDEIWCLYLIYFGSYNEIIHTQPSCKLDKESTGYLL